MNDKTNSRQDLTIYLHDDETLQELCGCLVSIAPRTLEEDGEARVYTASVATFSHFTVREYLDSSHFSRILNENFNTSKGSLIEEIMEIAFLEAFHIGSSELWFRTRPLEDSYDIVCALQEDLSTYCAVSALLSMRIWPREIVQHKKLSKLAIDLLDPSKSHFWILKDAMEAVTDGLYGIGTIYNEVSPWAMPCIFDQDLEERTLWIWNVRFDRELSESVALHLFNLLLLSNFTEDCLLYATTYLQNHDKRECLQSRLKLTIENVQDDGSCITYTFDESIIQIFAELSYNFADARAFTLLLEDGFGFYDPSNTLLAHIGFHFRDFHQSVIPQSHYNSSCDEDCPLTTLLKFGANPDMAGFRVTPLQIAVYNIDLAAVRSLLKVGVKINDTGDIHGTLWGSGTAMSRFNHLHNASPLYICRQSEIERGLYWLDEDGKERNVQQIEALLLEHGAESFMRPSEKGRSTPELQ